MHEALRQVLNQQASGIAHEVNNAIAPAALYAESLLEREPFLTAEGRKQLQIVQKAIDDTVMTVNHVRDIYHDREPSVVPTLFDLNLLVREVVVPAGARDGHFATAGAIECRLELEADPVLVLGVESEIREAIQILVTNASEAMHGCGQLSVSTARVQEGPGSATAPDPFTVCIEVRDTGCGMNDEIRTRCTEPFFTTKGGGGSGLGLAIVCGIARRHGADLDIESTTGQGTIVRISFPAARPSPQHESAADCVRGTAQGLHLLVVDDQPMVLAALCHMLEHEGHTVSVAADGQAGMDALTLACEHADQFDAIITDLEMPRIDGLKLARFAKGVSPATRVILLTGGNSPRPDDGDSASYVDLVLVKPPKASDLRHALAGVAHPMVDSAVGSRPALPHD